jgi:CysZ protein
MTAGDQLGANYLRRGFRLAMQPGLRRYVAVPLAINVGVFALLIYGGIEAFGHAIDWVMTLIPDWLDFIRYILWPLAVLLLLVVSMYTFSIVANFLAAPFNGLLCEKAEALLTGVENTDTTTLSRTLLMLPQSLGRELRKIGYYLPRALLVLIVSFIPGINVAAPVLWFLLGAWMMAIEYCDYPLDAHHRPFRDVKTLVGNNRLPSLGFGATIMLGTMIPIVNLVIMPAAVCGGVIFWLERRTDNTTITHQPA